MYASHAQVPAPQIHYASVFQATSCCNVTCIPPRRTNAPVACSGLIYTIRNLVERLWAQLKKRRVVAIRYEKTAFYCFRVLCPYKGEPLLNQVHPYDVTLVSGFYSRLTLW